jgi:cytochrome oxidase Cu insertion factor (SCO1/SenC/PrrC family)
MAPAAPLGSGDPGAARYFGDAALVNQHGERMRLYPDLIRGRTAVISVFFTTCSGVCPAVHRTLQKLQDRLGDRLGKDVSMISITVDPENDTPSRLLAYAERFKARRGWYFLTGTSDEVSAALKRLGQYVKDPNDHSGLVFAGNDRTGLWKKLFGLADPEEVIKGALSVADDRGEATP